MNPIINKDQTTTTRPNKKSYESTTIIILKNTNKSFPFLIKDSDFYDIQKF